LVEKIQRKTSQKKNRVTEEGGKKKKFSKKSPLGENKNKKGSSRSNNELQRTTSLLPRQNGKKKGKKRGGRKEGEKREKRRLSAGNNQETHRGFLLKRRGLCWWRTIGKGLFPAREHEKMPMARAGVAIQEGTGQQSQVGPRPTRTESHVRKKGETRPTKTWVEKKGVASLKPTNRERGREAGLSRPGPSIRKVIGVVGRGGGCLGGVPKKTFQKHKLQRMPG